MEHQDLMRAYQIVAEDILPRCPSPGIVFVRTKKDAALLGDMLNAPVVTGEVPVEARAKIAQAMRKGAVKVVVATDAWSTGIDIPCLRWVAVEAWTKAPIGVQQRVGRGARVLPDKPNYEVHVLPGRYEAEIRDILVGSGQAVQFHAPGTAPELADFLLLGRQPKGHRHVPLQQQQAPAGSDDWIGWFLGAALLLALILQILQCAHIIER